MDCSPPGFSVHGDSPGKNTGMGCHVLLQGIFQSQGLNPGLLHCRWILYCLSHQGSPGLLEWAAYPFSRVSSNPGIELVSCIAGGFFTSWATREAPLSWLGTVNSGSWNSPKSELVVHWNPSGCFHTRCRSCSNNENKVRAPHRKRSSEAHRLFTLFTCRPGIRCDMSYLIYMKCKDSWQL